MVTGFSKIIIAVQNLDSAALEYGALLGEFEPREGGALLPLANVAIELVQKPGAVAPAIDGIELWDESAATALPPDARDLPLSIASVRDTAADSTATGVSGVDHIVLRTRDADDCIRLFSGDLGMRLALDQAVPEWGGRMLFFRCGKLTLEVIQPLQEPVERDHFWGITYLTMEIEATLRRLDAAGVEHSGARAGRKPGTVVATVKSHNLGIPTLLIQPA